MAAGGLGASFLLSDSQAAADDKTIFCSEFVPAMQGSSLYVKWTRSSPLDQTRWQTFQAAVCSGGNPAPPAMSTQFGKALVAAGKMALPETPLPTTTTTTTGAAKANIWVAP